MRGSVERTASLAVALFCPAVAKQGGLGELSGLCKVYRPKRRPAEGVVLFRPILMWLCSASVVLGSTLHLALAIFQQGIPCFGHRPLFIYCWPDIRVLYFLGYSDLKGFHICSDKKYINHKGLGRRTSNTLCKILRLSLENGVKHLDFCATKCKNHGFES